MLHTFRQNVLFFFIAICIVIVSLMLSLKIHKFYHFNFLINIFFSMLLVTKNWENFMVASLQFTWLNIYFFCGFTTCNYKSIQKNSEARDKIFRLFFFLVTRRLKAPLNCLPQKLFLFFCHYLDSCFFF